LDFIFGAVFFPEIAKFNHIVHERLKANIMFVAYKLMPFDE